MKEPIEVAVTCTAFLAFLIFGLGMAISILRGRSNTLIAYKNDPTDLLHKMVRAHANACEYAPILGLLMLLLGTREPSDWVLWVFIAATVFRYLHAAGMIFGASLEQPNPLRFVGALGTYLSGIFLAIDTLRSV